MVYYFTSTAVDPPAYVYVGKDKFENEELIKYGWTDDIWFHADKLSSAHIYLRIPFPPPAWFTTWDALPAALITDLAQLTKANSIEGNKRDNVHVVYTPWANLHKDGSMAAGQVSFADNRMVRRVLVPARENPVVNRLNKTRTERIGAALDLAGEKEERLREERKRERIAREEVKKEEEKQKEEWAQKRWEKDHAYDTLFTEENMAATSNQDRDENWEDDFM